VDFSANSRAALRCGAALARRSHGSLTVLFVNDPLLVAAAAAAYDARTLARTCDLELRRFVLKALGSWAKTQPVLFLAAVGKPAQEIVRVSQRRRCDLIVMGTQGLSGPSKWFFGSVTQAVLRRAKVPVLAIPPRYRGLKALVSGARPWPGPHLLAPLDLSGDADADAARAAEVARGFGAKLALFHVVRTGPPPPWYSSDVPAYLRMEMAKARQSLESIGRPLADVVDACRSAVGNPAREVSALARNGKFGMVLLTLRGRIGLVDARAGSIAYQVLCRSKTPVLALPPLASRAGRRRPGPMKTIGRSIARGLARRDRVEMRAVERAISLLTPGTKGGPARGRRAATVRTW
jgi:nucleotide-binding universal stress UspA family protein